MISQQQLKTVWMGFKPKYLGRIYTVHIHFRYVDIHLLMFEVHPSG